MQYFSNFFVIKRQKGKVHHWDTSPSCLFPLPTTQLKTKNICCILSHLLSLSLSNIHQKPPKFQPSSKLSGTRNTSSNKGGMRDLNKQLTFQMVFSLCSFNKYLVSSHCVDSTVLRTVGNTTPFLESAFRRKIKDKKERKRKRQGKAEQLGETNSTDSTGLEKWFFGLLLHLETKNHSRTVAIFSLPKCQSKLLFCPGQVILYLRSFHRAYAKSA